MYTVTMAHILFVISSLLILTIDGLPSMYEILPNDIQDGEDEANNTAKDLYVVRAVVYEVGILTNVSSSEEDSSSDSNEEIDVSFFHQRHNGSYIDLSQIPLPVQTNITGEVITGLAPVGSIVKNGTVTPIVPSTILDILSNYSTLDTLKEQNIVSELMPLRPNNTV